MMLNIIRMKCLIAGDSTVGKSALVQSFLSDGSQFPKNYNMTLGFDLQTRLVNVPDTNYSVELYLYDLAGKDFYRKLILKMSSQPSLVLMVYDVTSESSFKNVADIFRQIKEETKVDTLKGILYGNKTDLTSRRLITPKAGQELAQKLGLLYFEGSSKEHNGVDEPFFYLVNEWFKTYTDQTQAYKLLS